MYRFERFVYTTPLPFSKNNTTIVINNKNQFENLAGYFLINKFNLTVLYYTMLYTLPPILF